MITLSDDGYVRLTFSSLRNTSLTHLLSGLDEDSRDVLQQEAGISAISGYTEWVSHTIPPITIGWDWRLDVSQGQPRCLRVGPPRSNLMLVDHQQRDLGPTHTAILLETAIDTIGWQDETLSAISARYR
jgi:hypothetical protein